MLKKNPMSARRVRTIPISISVMVTVTVARSRPAAQGPGLLGCPSPPADFNIVIWNNNILNWLLFVPALKCLDVTIVIKTMVCLRSPNYKSLGGRREGNNWNQRQNLLSTDKILKLSLKIVIKTLKYKYICKESPRESTSSLSMCHFLGDFSSLSAPGLIIAPSNLSF